MTSTIKPTITFPKTSDLYATYCDKYTKVTLDKNSIKHIWGPLYITQNALSEKNIECSRTIANNENW